MNRVFITGIDTSSLPKLTIQESNDLLKQISEGDLNAREMFLRANMRLVLSIVGRFSSSHENADDLFQAGMVGLVKSLNNFDNGYGVCFSTYAVPMIMGEIKRFIRDKSGIKVPRSMRDTAFKALKARELLSERNAEIELVEIAEEIGIPLKDVACALDAVSDTVSFYDPVFGDDDPDGLLILDQLADPKENPDRWTENIALSEAMRCVQDRERMVLNLRYFEGKTQVEISEITGISQAQVSRIEKSAIEKLKKCLC
ncbi:MAG: sigma-70 family RNA polymerase sigma factor [Clostridia bacterium]|nr:sigma-70 family RNA polymerase sigma factor [Clostridia bacterium]